MVRETTGEYEKPREYPYKKPEWCRAAQVESRSDIVIGGAKHAGSVSHPCTLPKNHEGQCVCECGGVWLRHFGE